MSAKLLVVDDEPATVEMIATFMEINAYEVVSAYSGLQGLSIMELEKPDMLILDLMMPDIEGFEFCERMRQTARFALTPILVISARTDPEAIERAYAAGANGYLTKPFNLLDLLGEVQRLTTA